MMQKMSDGMVCPAEAEGLNEAASPPSFGVMFTTETRIFLKFLKKVSKNTPPKPLEILVKIMPTSHLTDLGLKKTQLWMTRNR